MKKSFLFFAIASFSFFGCDYVEMPNQTNVVVAPTSDTVRKIFIEDFTGHTCPNCPSAARMIETLKLAYPGQIIPMAIHFDFFAEPCPPHALPVGALAGTFTEDFRVPLEDADYNAAFQINSWALPNGLINRSGFTSGSFPLAVDVWDDTVSVLLAKPMTAYIKLTSNFNSTTRALTVDVAGEFMIDTTGTYNIAVYLVEDGIHGSQTDNTLAGGIDNNYVFNSVFRGCINTPGTIGGEQVATGTILANTPINYSTTNSFTVNAAFIAANCKIVAILYKTSDYGVLQAAECDLQ